MTDLTPAITYKRGDANFAQGFLLMQNGVPFDISQLSGVVTVKWNFLENKPGAVKKTIAWTGSYSGTNHNRVLFVVPGPVSNVPFFNLATDYNSDIEVYNDESLVLHTDPSFIVRIKEVAGLHTDP